MVFNFSTNLSAFIMLTMSYWVPLLCCCQGLTCTTQETEIQMSCGEKGSGSSCSMSTAVEEKQQETVSPDESNIAASCQCGTHQTKILQTVLTPKVESQPDTLRTLNFLTPWMMTKTWALSTQNLKPANLLDADVSAWEPSLSALGRFLI